MKYSLNNLDDTSWTPILSIDGTATFTGNTNGRDIVENRFLQGVRTRYVRLYITDTAVNTALKWGLKGCQVVESENRLIDCFEDTTIVMVTPEMRQDLTTDGQVTTEIEQDSTTELPATTEMGQQTTETRQESTTQPQNSYTTYEGTTFEPVPPTTREPSLIPGR